MNTASAPTTDETSLSARETVKARGAYVRPHRWAVALGLLSAPVGAAGGLLQPLATKALVDQRGAGRTWGRAVSIGCTDALLGRPSPWRAPC